MALKKKIVDKPSPRLQTVVMGLDVGYGWTKAFLKSLTGDGHIKVKFPSVAAHAIALDFQEEKINREYPGDVITDEDGEWFIGELAIKHAPPEQQIMLQGRTNNEGFNMAFRVRMMRVAIAKALAGQFKDGEVVHIQIATGLPVDHMGDAAVLKAALIGQHPIKTNNADFVANVFDVIVIPQPYGTIYSVMMTADGELNEYHTAQRTAVVDVGRFTIDCTLDDDGEYVKADSDTLEAGVYTAEERLIAAYNTQYREPPTRAQLDKLLRTGAVRVNGKPVAYTAQRYEALKPLRDAVKTLMGRLWGTATDIDLILLTGGGIELVDKDTYQAYPQAEVVPDPQMANAIGYYFYALWLAKNPQ